MLQRLFLPLIIFGLVACTGLPLNAVAPKVSVAGVEIKSVGLFEQRFDVVLRVDNPNDFDLNIEALEFGLDVNGHPFASGQARTATLIPAASGTMLTVDAVTQSTNLIRQFRALPRGTLKEGVSYRISGRIKTDRSSRWIPFDHAGVYGGEHQKPEGRAV